METPQRERDRRQLRAASALGGSLPLAGSAVVPVGRPRQQRVGEAQMFDSEQFYIEATRYRAGLPNRLTEADIALVRRVSDFCRGPQAHVPWLMEENVHALVALVGAEHSPSRVLQCVAQELELMRNVGELGRFLSNN